MLLRNRALLTTLLLSTPFYLAFNRPMYWLLLLFLATSVLLGDLLQGAFFHEKEPQLLLAAKTVATTLLVLVLALGAWLQLLLFVVPAFLTLLDVPFAVLWHDSELVVGPR